ncbi:unnamed protein product [Sphenostylis stenocarpa]|uniref:Uncharacterized protein n=1 Tax=Sphenostylis stenocarpa TaxID=92480 RepID=A0AA86S860_9FABA|nr:unnamed protein product [Sphenostylis stenocarpa]
MAKRKGEIKDNRARNMTIMKGQPQQLRVLHENTHSHTKAKELCRIGTFLRIKQIKGCLHVTLDSKPAKPLSLSSRKCNIIPPTYKENQPHP